MFDSVGYTSEHFKYCNMEYSKEQIELAFQDIKISPEIINDFFNAIDEVILKEQELYIDSDNIFYVSEDINHKEYLSKHIANGDGYWDLFIEDNLPDYGVDEIEYFKVNSIIYKVKIHCDVDWCGDWSVRKNLPTSWYLTDIEEIIDYNIIEDENENGYIIFKKE